MSPIERYINNLTFNNICVYIRLSETMVEYLKQLQSFAHKQHDLFITMTDSLVRSIEMSNKDDPKDITYLTGWLKGYQSCRDDMMTLGAKDTNEQIVEITPTATSKQETVTVQQPISNGSQLSNNKKEKEPADFYM